MSSEDMSESSLSDEGLWMGVCARIGSGEGLLRLAQCGEVVHKDPKDVDASVGDCDISNGAMAWKKGVGGARLAGGIKDLVTL